MPEIYSASVMMCLLLTGSYLPGQTDGAASLHDKKVRQILPPDSALPPVLDLSNAKLSDGRASKAWEDKFTGATGVRKISDPGTDGLGGPSSISATTTEYVGQIYALPAKNSDAVVIATPVADRAYLSYNQRLVYSLFALKITEVLKGKGLNVGQELAGGQLGGSLRFPSGHLETFLVDNCGFLGLGKQYLLFIWKPIRSDETFVISKAYLIENGRLYSITSGADISAVEGKPLEEVKSRVKSAIAKGIDID